MKNRDLLLELLHDAEDFARMKNIECPPVYILGGSGCILGGYLDRGTLDIDFIDLSYDASVGRVFRLFDRFDMLDLYVTPVADDFEARAVKIEGFHYLSFYALSKEDIIVSKLGRYSDKDREDIGLLIMDCDKQLLNKLIENILSKENFSNRIRSEVQKNWLDLKGRYHV